MKTSTIRRIAASALTAAGLIASPGVFAQEIKHLNSGLVVPTHLPFSEAVRIGNTIYLSGQIGNKPGTLELVPGGIAAETRQVMENIKTTLEAHKLTWTTWSNARHAREHGRLARVQCGLCDLLQARPLPGPQRVWLVRSGARRKSRSGVCCCRLD